MLGDCFAWVLFQPHVWHYVFVIIIEQILWTKRRFTKSRSHCGGEVIFAQYTFGFNDRQTSMFGTVLILHVPLIHLLALGSIRSLVLRIDICSLVALPEWLQVPEWIQDVCWNEKHLHRWSNFRMIFCQLLSYKCHNILKVFIAFSLLLSESSHNAIHMIEYGIIKYHNVMHSNCKPFWHPQGPVSELP